ncbi:MAG: sigma-70 family RNA polymerase sigma factor [Caldilineaceae bacterium]|nr:sigma-70 family RNA polymerase sigma factor [Caldilineaceae bacterium]
MLTQIEEPSNAELLQRCQKGDSQAWQLIVKRYGRLVHSVPVRYGLSSGEIEDVGQEVFWALAQQLERIEEPERLGGWLLTTARRVSWRMMQRRRQEQPDAAVDVAENEMLRGNLVGHAQVMTYTELVAGWDRQAALQTGMSHLGERCRQLLSLIFLDIDEPSYEEISTRLSMPKGSIGPTRNRCLAQLRLILEGLGITSSE